MFDSYQLMQVILCDQHQQLLGSEKEGFPMYIIRKRHYIKHIKHMEYVELNLPVGLLVDNILQNRDNSSSFIK